ncbi:hypothetical protein [Mesorhizobium sp. SARCC-RB16n]|uniref:hypothetical protein n=1 Tax=Mesorhizobium sp. SARCC-RB16n TaxID=2116687 RepID=UPI001FEF5ACB|nr:hypothetical protein [Mesorhizobium sp. SARCC-RB16n]
MEEAVQNAQHKSKVGTQIEVVEGCGEWFVRVIGDGQETTCQFELESFALAYAEGQRLRLKLAGIKRL